MLGKILPTAANLLIPGSGAILGPVLDSLGVNASETSHSLFDKMSGLGLSGAGMNIAGGALGFLGLENGGWTRGSGARKNRLAGYVHENEFVFSSDAVDRIGVDNLDRLHRTARGYESGGYVSKYYSAVASASNKMNTHADMSETNGLLRNLHTELKKPQRTYLSVGDAWAGNLIGAQQQQFITLG